jgi:hypothetical protein
VVWAGCQPGFANCFDRCQDAGNTGFVIQVARANEAIGRFHTGVKGNKITNLYT